MKKLLRSFVAVLLAVSMSCVALAAPSKTTLAEFSYGYDANGTSVSVTVSASNQSLTINTAATIIGGGVSANNITIVSQMSISVPSNATYPLTLTFSVSGIKAGDEVYVLVWNGSSWVKTKAVAGDGTVTVTLDSEASELAIVLAGDGNGTGTGTTDTSSGSGTSSDSSTSDKSPKTGATDDVYAVAVIALAASAAACVVYKKKKA